MSINKNNVRSKKVFILFGFLFLTILLLNTVSAVDMCWVEASSADCITNNGEVVMSVSGATNAHGALAGQGTFIPVLCCNFGEGDTTCTVDNKIIGLSSSTNAHAEAPDLASPNYNIDVCYDSLKYCSSVDSGFSCGIGEIEVAYISNLTNAHIEEAGLQEQNYDTKICCLVEYLTICDLTSAEWQDEEVMEGADVGLIVNGINCDEGEEISFEVFRGTTSCNSIDGCENPLNVNFTAGSNSVAGTWSAGPYHDNEYHLVAKVVANPGETVPSSEPDLLVIAECPYDPEPVVCMDYTTESHCNSNICEIDVQDSVPTDVNCSDSGVTCECVWDNNECKASWGGTGGYCGDGVINPGETCDDDWGSITDCSDFDVFTGGDLSCVDCQFNTTLCTGGTIGICGDGEINTGEQCDGSDWWPITGCSDFDFEGGILNCYAPGTSSECLFDTSQCTGGIEGAEVGICIYNQTITNSCEEEPFGSLSFSWIGKWTWDDGCDVECQIANKDKKDLCEEGGTRTFECPAQIPLPFFNIYSFIATLSIIALIYVILILRKEKRKR